MRTICENVEEIKKNLSMTNSINPPKNIITQIYSLCDNIVSVNGIKDEPMPIATICNNTYICPVCCSENKCSNGIIKDNYCPICGQKLAVLS